MGVDESEITAEQFEEEVRLDNANFHYIQPQLLPFRKLMQLMMTTMVDFWTWTL